MTKIVTYQCDVCKETYAEAKKLKRVVVYPIDYFANHSVAPRVQLERDVCAPCLVKVFGVESERDFG